MLLLSIIDPSDNRALASVSAGEEVASALLSGSGEPWPVLRGVGAGERAALGPMPSSQLSGDHRQGETFRRSHEAAQKQLRGKHRSYVETRPHLGTETQVVIILFLHDQRSVHSRNQYISIHATFSYLSEVTDRESLCQ